MTFVSILSEAPESTAQESVGAPEYFGDLNLEQIVELITAEFKEYELKSFYYSGLHDLESIQYRQEIMQDLDDPIGMRAVTAFSEKMRQMRALLNQAKQFHYYPHTVTRRFLAAVDTYCEAVACLHQDLSAFDACSRGLCAFREYLTQYVAAESFRSLVKETAKLRSDLSAIRYSLLMDGGSITVWNYNGEPDYSAAVEETFAKFRRGAVGNHWVDVPRWSGMNHIEAQIQDRVALLYPAIFHSLDAYYAANTEYVDKKIERFDREVQFYVAYLGYVAKFRSVGLDFCQPLLSRTSKAVLARNTFDLALAGKLIREKKSVVPNDFSLSGSERILVVSGPNQGGKTTFARTFGQLHHLASLGCLVPGKEARLYLFDRLFTHFERAEDPTNLRGKLQDDLVRVHQILGEATPSSIVIMNEIFSSTTVKDAIYLSEKIIGRMSELDLLGVCVTFLDELASFTNKTVSMVSTVDPTNPAVRTFKLVRKPADGLAYALAIAEKYHVTYNWIHARVKE
ncbi:MAG: MutS-related protein [Candidatus Acidiferrales bacterium]